ncbi:MAG: HYR domain-containing protein, partial [Rubripirellula sp.]
DNVVFVATIDADGDGTVVVSVPASAATDLASNANLASSDLELIVDTTLPTAVIEGPDQPIATDVFDVTLRFDEVVVGLSAADIDVNNGRVTRLRNLGEGVFVATIDTFNDGVVSVNVPADVVADEAGNLNAEVTEFTVLVDVGAPVLTLPVDITIEGDQFDGASIQGDAVTTFLTGASALDSIDSNPVIATDAPDLLVLGANEISFTATDALGNATTAVAIITVVDTAAPELNVPIDQAIEADGPDGISLVNATLQSLLRTATATDVVDRQVALVHDVSASLALGDHTITYTATDDSGNETTGSFVLSVVDTTGPVIDGPTDLVLEGNVIGGADVADAAIEAMLASATAVDLVDPNPSIVHDAPQQFAVGDTVVTFTATDASGNESFEMVTVTVTDTVAPGITPPTATTVEADSAGGANFGGESVAAFLNSVVVSDVVDVDPSVTSDGPSLLPLGETTVTFTVTDDAGNSATASSIITVVDTTGPALSLPVDLQVQADTANGVSADDAAITDFLSQATAQDIVDGAVEVTHDGPAVFLIGDTVVTFTATDLSGNTSTQTAVVTVTGSYDFGDAPTLDQSGFAANYPVTVAENGARHFVGPLFLGSTIDSESDGQPLGSGFASGDGDDEDGVVFNASVVTVDDVSTTSSVSVTASMEGKLDAWVDFNRDGDWDDEGELIFGAVDLVVGVNVLPFTVPAGSEIGTTAARFRLSSAGGLSPTGVASDGEVEDYGVEIVDGNDPASVFVDAVSIDTSVRVDQGEMIVSGQSSAGENVTLFSSPVAVVGELDIRGRDTDDTLVFASIDEFTAIGATVNLTGNAGVNRLAVGSGLLDTTESNLAITGFDTIDLDSTESVTLAIDAASVAATSPSTRQLTVLAEVNDSLTIADVSSWQLTEPTIINGRFFVTADTTASGGNEFLRASLGRGWQNFLRPGDINNDGEVTASDALRIINELGRRQYSDSDSQDLQDPATVEVFPGTYFDHNGDNRATALDALRVINDLARQANSNSNSLPVAEQIIFDSPIKTTSMPVSRSSDDAAVMMDSSRERIVGEPANNRIDNSSTSGSNASAELASEYESAGSGVSESAVDQLLTDESFLSSIL